MHKKIILFTGISMEGVARLCRLLLKRRRFFEITMMLVCNYDCSIFSDAKAFCATKSLKRAILRGGIVLALSIFTSITVNAQCSIGLDTDGDGVSDVCDIDDANDGILDVNESLSETTPDFPAFIADTYTATGIFTTSSGLDPSNTDDSYYIPLALGEPGVIAMLSSVGTPFYLAINLIQTDGNLFKIGTQSATDPKVNIQGIGASNWGLNSRDLRDNFFNEENQIKLLKKINYGP